MSDTADGAWIEQRGDVPVLVFATGGCRPATPTEVAFWQDIGRLTAERDRLRDGIAEHRDKLGEPAGIYDERLWSLLDD